MTSGATIPLNAGDYVSVWVYQFVTNPTTTADTSITTWFSITQTYDSGTSVSPTTASPTTATPTAVTSAPTPPTTRAPTPTTAVPSRSPTSANTGYVQVYAGTPTTPPSGAWTEFTTYWTAGLSPKTAGTTISVVSSGRLAVSVAGAYLAVFDVLGNSVGSLGGTAVEVTKNGAAPAFTNIFASHQSQATANVNAYNLASNILVMAASDFVSAWAFNAASRTYATANNPQFTLVATGGQPYVIVSGIASQSISAATITQLTTYWTGSTAPQYSGGIYSVPSNGRIQTSQTGIYLVSWAMVIVVGASGGQQGWMIRNGATSTATNRIAYFARDDFSAGTGVIQPASAIVQLNAGDFIQTNVYFDAATSTNGNTAQFSLVRVTGDFASFTSAGPPNPPQVFVASVNTEVTSYWNPTLTSTGTTYSSPAAGRIRVNTAGGYFVTFGITWSSATSTNAYRNMWVFVNGNTATNYGIVGYGTSAPAAAPTVYPKATQSSAFVVLNAGDYVSVWAACASPVQADGSITTSFSIVQMYNAGTSATPSRSPSQAPSFTKAPTSVSPSATPTSSLGSPGVGGFSAGYITYFAGTNQAASPTPSASEITLGTYWQNGLSTLVYGTALNASVSTRFLPATSTTAFVAAAGVPSLAPTSNVYIIAASMVSGFATSVFRDYILQTTANNLRYAEVYTGYSASGPFASNMATLMPIAPGTAAYIDIYTNNIVPMQFSPRTSFSAIATNAKPYYIRSTLSPTSTQAITTGTVTPLAALFSTGGTLLSSGNIFSTPGANGQIQTSQAGAYLFFANIQWSTTGSANYQNWWIMNGASTLGTNRICFFTDSRISGNIASATACLVVMNSGDYLQLNVYQDQGTTNTLTANAGTLYTIAALRTPYPYMIISSTTLQYITTSTETEVLAYWTGSAVQSSGTVFTLVNGGRYVHSLRRSLPTDARASLDSESIAQGATL